jgi:hypothetical protein
LVLGLVAGRFRLLDRGTLDVPGPLNGRTVEVEPREHLVRLIDTEARLR